MSAKTEKLYKNKEWLEEQIKEHIHIRTISQIHGINETTLRQWIKKNKVEKHELRRSSGRRHFLNERYFDFINSEDKAYWLGFIMADGCVSTNGRGEAPTRFQMPLKISDLHHIEKFKNALDYDYEIKVFDSINKKLGIDTEVCEIRVQSKIFVQCLMKHGVCQNKTGNEILPDTIPSHLVKHFIRGYFDGDGSLTINRAFRICSCSKLILTQVNKYFEDTCSVSFKIYGDPKYKKTLYTIDSKNYTNNKIVLDHLYDGATVYLQRKYDRYLNLYCPTSQ